MAENTCSSYLSDAGSNNKSSTSELPTHDLSGQCSLLEHLKRLNALELSRKWKILCNQPKGLKKGNGIVTAEPRNVTALSRVVEFSNQNVSVVVGKLFCLACRENFSLKKVLFICILNQLIMHLDLSV